MIRQSSDPPPRTDTPTTARDETGPVALGHWDDHCDDAAITLVDLEIDFDDDWPNEEASPTEALGAAQADSGSVNPERGANAPSCAPVAYIAGPPDGVTEQPIRESRAYWWLAAVALASLVTITLVGSDRAPARPPEEGWTPAALPEPETAWAGSAALEWATPTLAWPEPPADSGSTGIISLPVIVIMTEAGHGFGGAVSRVTNEPSGAPDLEARPASAGGAEPVPEGAVPRTTPHRRPLTEPSLDETQLPDSFDLSWKGAPRRAIAGTDQQIPATRLQPHGWSRGGRLDQTRDRQPNE